MASHTLVKNYLAQWMQMGKAVILPIQNEEVLIWNVLQGDNYSALFNQLWDRISTTQAEEAYLNGTDQTISDLLSNRWEIIACARCDLLVPSIDLGPRVTESCPCDDLPNHPNLDLVMPHLPTKLGSHLNKLCDRLAQKSTDTAHTPNESHNILPNTTYVSDEDRLPISHDLKKTILKLVKSNK